MKKFAFVFPGQGSQSPGMMNGFANHPAVRNTFAEASDILNENLWKLVEEGSDTDLNATVNTQPVMLTAGIAVYRAWKEQHGADPQVMAGHSLGEYTALTAAGALSFTEALPLVRYRAQCMQQAVPEGVGGIAAVLGLDDDAVRSVCTEGARGEVLEAVNYNSPGQVVIAGNRTAVERGIELAKARGAKRAIMLPMSVPSHCILLKGAAEQLREYMINITVQVPAIPVLHNADVKSYTNGAMIKDALVRQLYSPVRWVEIVLEFGKQGITHNAECAPGKVLTGLNKRIAPDQQSLAISDSSALTQALTILT
jgi:[acyl-carrier-protein] S-malonyltransferase